MTKKLIFENILSAMKALIKTFLLLIVAAAIAVPSVGLADEASNFSSPAAAASFKSTGDMAVHVAPSALASQVISGVQVKQIARSTGCSVGCTVGCTTGCTTGCSFGCK